MHISPILLSLSGAVRGGANAAHGAILVSAKEK